MIAIQVMINVGVVTGLMPVTGITCRFKLWWIKFDINVNGSRCIIKYKSPFSLLNPVYKTGFSYVKMQYVYRNKYNGNKKREAEELVVRVLVSGGGTGGHIYPALALIREIKS